MLVPSVGQFLTFAWVEGEEEMQPWGPDHFMEGVLDEEQRLAA